MNNKNESTFDRLMKSPARKKAFDKGYQEFLLSELIHAVMQEDRVSVRKLASDVGVSPSVIQDIRSGKRSNITLKNFLNIMKSLGCNVLVQKGGKRLLMSLRE